MPKQRRKSASRSIDDLGRFVIPINIRDELGWGQGTKLEVTISDLSAKEIAVREISPCCTLCRRESENLVAVERGYVCPLCSARIYDLIPNTD